MPCLHEPRAHVKWNCSSWRLKTPAKAHTMGRHGAVARRPGPASPALSGALSAFCTLRAPQRREPPAAEGNSAATKAARIDQVAQVAQMVRMVQMAQMVRTTWMVKMTWWLGRLATHRRPVPPALVSGMVQLGPLPAQGLAQAATRGKSAGNVWRGKPGWTKPHRATRPRQRPQPTAPPKQNARPRGSTRPGWCPRPAAAGPRAGSRGRSAR